ncbi:MAG: hypothetical protein ACK5NT_13880 [Pyrinomonadaceae bacterium]
MYFSNMRYIFVFLSLAVVCSSCSSQKSVTNTSTSSTNGDLVVSTNPNTDTATAERSKGSFINIEQDSPADSVRIFYKRLRENKFRDAIMLTNMRPAVEGLTNDELNDLGIDFGYLAKSVPNVVPINGQIVTGDDATVTVKLPNEETKKDEVQEIRLQKKDGTWQIKLTDSKGEKLIKQEGNRYFFTMRMDVHHQEAKAMLDRIGKAQMIYSLKNGGKFASLETLISKGYVPQDAETAESTGYKYNVVLASDNSTYTATATPAEYGKSGKLSFALRISKTSEPHLVSKDLLGKPFGN